MSATASQQSAAKKLKVENGIGIVTHSGSFHADEALAVALLRKLPQFSQLPLTRTRDLDTIAKGTIVVDVGATYEPDKDRYDHHQRGFEETFDADHKVKLSSAGLVWKHFGKEVITATDPSLSSDVIDRLYMKMYESFVQAIDGIDNGVPLYPASAGEPAYSSKTDLSSRVGYLNPRWNQQADEAEYMARFEKASKMAGEEFFDRLDYAIHAWIPALNIVLEAVQKRKQAAGGDPQGRLIIFEDFANWKEHLFNLEKELNIPEAEKPLYILYPDESGKWRIQAVPESPSSFASRKALPEPWRGIRDEELSKLSGIPGCIFVHQSGFIGGNQTKEGAVAMAHKALEWA